MKRFIFGTLVILSGLPGGEAIAQANLRLIRADTVGPQIVYSYEIRGGENRSRAIDRAGIDVSSPKAAYPPSILGVRGEFMYDALKTRFNAVNIGHAPLFVGTPGGWFGLVSLEGRAEWWALEEKHQVRYQTSKGAFILKSPALPAFRRWYLDPERPLLDADQVDGPAPDPTLAGRSGYIIAPGWMASDVTAGYLQAQVEVACAVGMVPVQKCNAYKSAVNSVKNGEIVGDTQYLMAVGGFRSLLARDSSLASLARLVWGRAIEALAVRVPSKR